MEPNVARMINGSLKVIKEGKCHSGVVLEITLICRIQC